MRDYKKIELKNISPSPRFCDMFYLGGIESDVLLFPLSVG